MTHQLPLNIQLNQTATLADFSWGDKPWLQEQLMHTLHGEGERVLYIWGPPGCGKSHVLQACCQTARHAQGSIYLPLDLLHAYGPGILDGIEEQSLIAIDDLDIIAQNPAWEEAIFHVYNKIRDSGRHCLLLSGTCAPMNMPIRLADLRSRLSGGLVIQLQELPDLEKIKILQHHAHGRGLTISANVAHFLLRRCTRNLHDLLQCLNQLDEASLIAQRKITIPFVKQVLNL